MNMKHEAPSEYKKLVGMKVMGIVVDPGEDGFIPMVFGIQLSGTTKGKKKNIIAWILCDPEGNGPGFLSVEDE